LIPKLNLKISRVKTEDLANRYQIEQKRLEITSRSAEVMTLLSELHRAGSTICMVTHDQRYAGHAAKEVHLFDGRVVKDQPSN
jgi:ABC-type cobalamin/Fe3+-siderophores transport system ATPase subunit